MSRFARMGVCAMALAAAGAASGSAAPGADTDGREKRAMRFVHRGGGGYLGVQLADVAASDVARLKLDDERGALVREVVEDGPAAEAGLKVGDVILRYQGETVRSAAQLARLVGETPTGRTVQIELSREGALETLPVTLAERNALSMLKGLPDLDFNVELPEPPEAPDALEAPEAPQAPEPPSRWTRDLLDRDWPHGLHFGWGGPRKLGIGYQEISGQLAGYFKLAGDSGVLVTEVDADGPAGKAGMKAGDVILDFDGREIRDAGDLRKAVRARGRGARAGLEGAARGPAARPQRDARGQRTGSRASEERGHPGSLLRLQLQDQQGGADRQSRRQQHVRERDDQRDQAGQPEAQALGAPAAVPGTPRPEAETPARQRSVGVLVCERVRAPQRADERPHERDQAQQEHQRGARSGSTARS